MIFGVLDADGTFTFTNAGHGPAMVVVGGACQVLPAHRAPLGVGFPSGEEEAKQTTLRLNSGDRVFLCSDGVNEAMDAHGEQFGLDRLARIVADLSIDQDQVVARVRDAIRGHTGLPMMKDDVTILCVDRVDEATAERTAAHPRTQSVNVN
jgi:serine phosphatase RsbU (regulator of sigma subunit)